MIATPGEQLVGAYLKIVEGCDVVSYNVRPPGGGLRGLELEKIKGLVTVTNERYAKRIDRLRGEERLREIVGLLQIDLSPGARNAGASGP